MKKKELQALAQEAAKNIKSEEDLNEFRQMLTKITVEAALNAALDDHLGFDKYEQTDTDNCRNGYTSKTLQTENGRFEVDTPRDREGSFEPLLVKKHQRRFTSMDDKILFLYAQGMTTREIVTTFKEMYGADVSAALISKVTDAVIEQVVEWQSRPLDSVYPIVYLDCIVVKIRQDKKVINKSIYLALGVNMEGQKELLGMWLSENEGSKFWLNVLQSEFSLLKQVQIVKTLIDQITFYDWGVNVYSLDDQEQKIIVGSLEGYSGEYSQIQIQTNSYIRAPLPRVLTFFHDGLQYSIYLNINELYNRVKAHISPAKKSRGRADFSLMIGLNKNDVESSEISIFLKNQGYIFKYWEIELGRQ